VVCGDDGVAVFDAPSAAQSLGDLERAISQLRQNLGPPTSENQALHARRQMHGKGVRRQEGDDTVRDWILGEH
jgi:hypothetical protein